MYMQVGEVVVPRGHVYDITSRFQETDDYRWKKSFAWDYAGKGSIVLLVCQLQNFATASYIQFTVHTPVVGLHCRAGSPATKGVGW
jgi:hypothetical protein